MAANVAVLTLVVLVIALLTQIAASVVSIRNLAYFTRPTKWLPVAGTVLLCGRSVIMLGAAATDVVDPAAPVVFLIEALMMLISLVTFGALLALPYRFKHHLETFKNLQLKRRALQQRVSEQEASLAESVSRLQAESLRRQAVVNALQTVESVYSRTLDAQPDRICRYRTDGTITYANQRYCEALGIAREGVVGRSVFEIVPAEFHSAIRDAIKRLDQAMPVLSSEQYVVRLDGEHWERWTRHAIFDTGGSLIEIQAVGREITAQRQAERALRENEQRLRQMFEQMPVLLIAMDADDTLVHWSRECERVTGYSAAEMVGHSDGFARMYPDETYRITLEERFRDLDRDFRAVETAVTCKDGSTRFISWSNISRLQPMPGWDRWAVGVDVTARKLAEAALQRAYDLLETQVAARTAELRAAQGVLQREISERHRAEIAVRQSQTQLRATLDAIDDMVYVVDADLRIIVCNAALLRFAQESGIGTDPIGRTPFEVFPFLSDRIRDEYFRVFETGEPVNGEDAFEMGTVRWVNETRKIPICGAQGEVTHVLTVVHDITERTRAAAQLAASERKFRTLIEQSPYGLVLTNAQGVIVEWNAAMIQITGIPREDAVGRPMWELEQRLIPAEYQRDGWQERQRQYTLDFLQGKAGPSVDLSYAMRTQDGTPRTVRANIFLLHTAEGPMAASFVEDVTVEQTSTQALHISENRLRTLIAAMPDIVIVKDGEGRWLLANEAALQLFELDGVAYQGRANAELAEQSPFFRMALLACDEMDAAAWQAGAMSTSEETFPQRDGPPRVFDVIKIPLFDAQGARRELLLVGREITERQRAERHAFQVAVERERSTILADFIRDTSHEFANPLSVIKTNVYIAQQIDDPERVAALLEGIRGQTLHIEKLVKGLLAMSQLDQYVPLSRSAVQLGDLLHRVVDAARGEITRRAHTVSLELVEDLPALHADEYWLERALVELLHNAIQHIPDGGTIMISAAQNNGEIVVSVHDDGDGIAADHLPHIFERFYRVDKARAARGAGLGLAIAQQVIERHGGRITVESTPGEGCIFRLYLPIPSA